MATILDSSPKQLGVIGFALNASFDKDDINILEASAAGGGSTALAFLETIHCKHNTMSIQKLRNILEAIGDMTKSLNVLDNYQNALTIGDLCPQAIYELSLAMTVPINTSLSNWENVAEYFNDIDIAIIKSKIKSGGEYSCSSELMRLIEYKYTDINIGCFLEIVHKIGNNKAVEEIEEQIKIIVEYGECV